MSIEVHLENSMGDDLTVVNAARVSFNKRSFPEPYHVCCGNPTIVGGDCCGNPDTALGISEKDQKLIKYLAKHKHKSPFNHAFMSFRVKAPIFVARQLVKHKFLVWNEVSRRYVDSEPELFTPEQWRKRAENVKQGSSEEAVSDEGFGTAYMFAGENKLSLAVERLYNHTKNLYEEMLEHGVCPEQARMVLPQSMMTEWWWSGSLGAFADMCILRLDSHTQKETRDVADAISRTAANLFPCSWEALMEYGGK